MKAPQHRSNTRWTKEELDYVARRVCEGAVDFEIACEMGTSRTSLRKARNAAGILSLSAMAAGRKRVQWTRELDEALLKMRDNGRAWADIGQRLGVSGDACRGRFCRLVANGRAKVSLDEDSLPFLVDIRVPTPKEQRRAFDAELLRAENAARTADYRRALNRNAPPPDWQPGDPATW